MRAVVFDLDGTLIDSLPDIATAVNHTLAARRLDALPPGQVKSMIGDGAKVLLARSFAVYNRAPDESDMAVFMAWYTAHAADETVAYPGIEPALRDLRAAGHKIGVCTNKPAVAAREILAQLGLDKYFSALTGGDTTPYRKPDPRHLAATIAALGAPDAVMIGDHHNDMAAAAGLGVPGIFAAWGYGEAQGDFAAKTASELPGLIARLPVAG